MPTKTTCIIVPGAFLKVSSWGKFSLEAKVAGYAVEIVALPTIGGPETPLATLDDDIAAVQAALDKVEARGEKALLLCHSTGAFVAAQALKGRQVAGMIFISGVVAPCGKTIYDVSPEREANYVQWDEDRKRAFIIPSLMPEVNFNDMDEDLRRMWCRETTYTATSILTTPAFYEPWAHGVPICYISTTMNNALVYEVQESMIDLLGENGDTRVLEAGNCPHLSMPTTLLAMVQSIQEEMV